MKPQLDAIIIQHGAQISKYKNVIDNIKGETVLIHKS